MKNNDYQLKILKNFYAAKGEKFPEEDYEGVSRAYVLKAYESELSWPLVMQPVAARMLALINKTEIEYQTLKHVLDDGHPEVLHFRYPEDIEPDWAEKYPAFTQLYTVLAGAEKLYDYEHHPLMSEFVSWLNINAVEDFNLLFGDSGEVETMFAENNFLDVLRNSSDMNANHTFWMINDIIETFPEMLLIAKHIGKTVDELTAYGAHLFDDEDLEKVEMVWNKCWLVYEKLSSFVDPVHS